jgi:hypothetical protein
VYDNICYSPAEALHVCEVYAGKVKWYIFTSTLSVYSFGPERKKEEDFNLYTYEAQLGNRTGFDTQKERNYPR